MSTASYVSDVKSKISLRPSQRAVKRAALALALTLGIAAVADLGYDYLTTGRYLESTDDAYVKADSTIVSPKVSGYIAQVLVGDNQPVKAGQLLARIDDRDFKAALDQAHADVDAAEAAVRNLDAQIALQQPIIEQGTADVAAAEANLQFAQAGTQLMAVVPLDAVYVVANFKETQLTHVRNGQPVEITIDSFHGTKLRGHVDSLSPASGLEFALLPPDNATGNFTKIVQRVPVKIVLDDHTLTGLLRPGMSAEPTVDTKTTVLAERETKARLASDVRSEEHTSELQSR